MEAGNLPILGATGQSSNSGHSPVAMTKLSPKDNKATFVLDFCPAFLNPKPWPCLTYIPFPSLLSTLKALIKRLPPICPQAPKNRLIHNSFSNLDMPVGGGLYYVVDQAWTRTFQGKSDVAIRGKYGVGVVYSFFTHFSKQDMGNELGLLELCIKQFINILRPQEYYLLLTD